MANRDAPNGARASHHQGGQNRKRGYPIASGYNTSIYEGDFVALVAGGGIELAAVTDRLLGVFAGCEYVDSEGRQQFSKKWPANTVATEIKALVYDDPNTIFRIQADGAVTADDVGQLADHVQTHAGNDRTGRSGEEISSTTGTAAAQLRILGKIDGPDNDWGANVELLVQIYEHEFSRNDPATPGV